MFTDMRKGFNTLAGFVTNVDTAEDAALYYSLLGSCRQAGINSEEWLLYVLDNIKDCKSSNLHKLLPKNWKPPDVA
jgi:hypothetical protein